GKDLPRRWRKNVGVHSAQRTRASDSHRRSSSRRTRHSLQSRRSLQIAAHPVGSPASRPRVSVTQRLKNTLNPLPHSSGEIISYLEMCQAWSAHFQRGMNFHIRPGISVILMSRRSNAPYRDSIEDDGKVLIYEGHDTPKTKDSKDPKTIDQPRL